jgi:hypothetical protein
MPLAAKNVLEQHVAAARCLSVNPVVGAHQGVRTTVPYSHLEMRQIALAQIALAHHCIELVPRRLRPAMHGEVFHRCDGLEILRVIALKTVNELHRQCSGEKRILSVSLLPPSPSRIAEQVDVGRPEGEALVAAVAVVADVLVVLGARFVGDHRRREKHQRIIPCRGESNGLRKHRREPRARDAMKRLVPPVVHRNAEPVDGGSDVFHLRDFFFQCHPAHEIARTLLEAQVRIAITGRRVRRLSHCCTVYEQQQGAHKSNGCAESGWGAHLLSLSERRLRR